MKIVNFAEMNSELNRFVAEIRDIHIQQDRLRFRKNLERIGEVMSYEISKTGYDSIGNSPRKHCR